MYLDNRELPHRRGPRCLSNAAHLHLLSAMFYRMFQDPLLLHPKQLPHDYSAAALSGFSRFVLAFARFRTRM